MSECEPVSVIIRAWNEAEPLARLLGCMATQDYPGEVELVVVDSGSTDNTAAVARAAGATVITLPQEQFSYPKSLNVGLAAASHEIVAEIVAYALPIENNWLSSGVKHFVDPKVAGVYAPTKAKPTAKFFERLLYNPNYYWTRLFGPKEIARTYMGVFGATNIMLRRSLWLRHHFDERFGAGGEDTEWADWALEQGYVLIRDPEFAVYHSHGLNVGNLLKQQRYWASLKKPRPFSKREISAYRTDL